MGYMALYRKWRPSDFDEVKGQDAIVQTLRNQIIYNRIGHAYLFCGTRGTGKTSIAKLFAKAVNCEHPVNGNPCNACPSCQAINAQSSLDVLEIDAASNNGVENIREEIVLFRHARRLVPAGLSTLMMIGATTETDYQIVKVAEALYRGFALKRVFYSAYMPVHQEEQLPMAPGGGSLLREHRLYQADWLMRFYAFHSGELLSEEKPNFNVLLDPKCDWAIRHLEQFPVEINRADYYTLLRVPGIGVRSAQRIVKARRSARLDFKDIKKMGVVLKRALYFITCSGRTLYPIRMNEDFITNRIIGVEALNRYQIEHHDSYRQLSLFDDFHMDTPSSDK